MKELPIGRQTFSEFIEQDLLYVDKTRWVWELTRQGKFYFLARPRRFGKSLLLSTLKSFFEGREDLFRGLYLHKKVKEWKKSPVLYIDYSLIEYRIDAPTFRDSLLSYLRSLARNYNLVIDETIVPNYFRELILRLHEQYGQVVILVDEYDKPLVDTLNDEKKFEENRDILNGLYGSIKGLDNELRFVFLTGVSRFAKVGIFSGLNNLDDISTNEKFSNIVGFSQGELERYFPEYIEKLRQKFQLSPESIMEHIKFWYNGFSWDGETRLYNPFSILNLFNKKAFENYWFTSGTPSFLMRLLKKEKQLPETFENLMVHDLTGSSMNAGSVPLLPLLFQTGYLTIDRVVYEGIRKRYVLNYPNEEVRYSFLTHVVATFVDKDQVYIQPEIFKLRDALIEEKTDLFIRYLRAFLADIPSRLHIPKEAYYHSLVYMLLRLVGAKMTLEKETDKGRIDGVLELERTVYIIEFKFATGKRIRDVKTLARNALKQIDDRRYYEAYQNAGKKIVLLGIGFLDKEIDGRAKVLP